MNWELKKVKVEYLKEYENNPRRLEEHKLKHLEDSIKKFGLAEPIVVNIDNVICGGHGRLHVLKKLKIQEVDCYFPERALNQKEFDELNVRLNKNTAGVFDFDILANMFEVDDLKDMGFTEKELGIDVEISNFDFSDDNYKGDESLSIPQISYNLVFDNDQQQKVWYEFLKYLKNKYNDSDTHASRINKFIEENAVEED